MRSLSAMRVCGAIAATGTLGVAATSIAMSWSKEITPEFQERPTDTVLTGLLIVALACWQIFVVIQLLRGRPGAERLGRRSVVTNAIIGFLLVGVAGVFQTERTDFYVPFSAFGSVWIGFYRTGVAFPALMLAQWFCLSLADDKAPREAWRGLAIACIAYSAVLGVWVFSPMYSGWAFFTGPTATFFNLGVAVHLVAILWLAKGWKADWAMAGLIGFGCLISGLILINQHFDHQSFAIDSSTPLKEIGSILKFGWVDLTNYLAPAAYVLTAGASIALYRSRAGSPEPGQPASLRAGSSPTPSSS